MTFPFKKLFGFLIVLSISVKLNAQDSTVMRYERFKTLKNLIKNVNHNSLELTEEYKRSNLIATEEYENLNDKITQLGKVLGNKTILDSFYVRILNNKYEDVVQKIIDLTDSLQKNIKIGSTKMKGLIDKFYKSYFKTESSIDSYDGFNWNNKGLLFRNYLKAVASPM